MNESVKAALAAREKRKNTAPSDKVSAALEARKTRISGTQENEARKRNLWGILYNNSLAKDQAAGKLSPETHSLAKKAFEPSDNPFHIDYKQQMARGDIADKTTDYISKAYGDEIAEREKNLSYDTAAAKTNLTNMQALLDNDSDRKTYIALMSEIATLKQETDGVKNDNSNTNNPIGKYGYNPVPSSEYRLKKAVAERDELLRKYGVESVDADNNFFSYIVPLMDTDSGRYEFDVSGNGLREHYGEKRTEYEKAVATQAPGKAQADPKFKKTAQTGASLAGDVDTEFMEDAEKDVMYYYYGLGDTETAEIYYNSLANVRKLREAQSIAKGYDDKWYEFLPNTAAGVETGLTNLTLGAYNMVTGKDKETEYSPRVLASEIARSNNTGAQKVINDLAFTTGNMLPSIGASAITTVVTTAISKNPVLGAKAGKIVGSVTMGVSSAGGAYNEMIKLGYTPEQSRAYGILVGLSETGLEYALGGISKFGGGGGELIDDVYNATLGKKLNNVLARVAINHPNLVAGIGVAGKMTAAGLSESFEEGTQTFLEPWFKSIVTGEDYMAPEFEEVAYNSLIGFLSGGMFEGAENASDVAKVAGSAVNTVAKGVDRILVGDGKYIADGISANMAKSQTGGDIGQNGNGDIRYSLGETTDGRAVAVVDNDILADIYDGTWDEETKKQAKKAAKTALLAFKDGIKVNGVTAKVNKTSRAEYTHSNYTEALYTHDPDTYADKMRAASVAKDVVTAATNWSNDGGLTHARKDNFVDFASGRTLIKSGNATYEAEVILGITADGEYVFYDVADMKPANFNIKQQERVHPVTPNESFDGLLNAPASDTIIPQSSDIVNSENNVGAEAAKAFSQYAQGVFEDIDNDTYKSELMEDPEIADAVSDMDVGEGDTFTPSDGVVKARDVHEDFRNTGKFIPDTPTQEFRKAEAAKAKNDIQRSGILAGASKADIRLAEIMSALTGRNVIFESDDYRINGYFDGDNTIFVNVDRADGIFAQVLAHELTHSVEGTKAYVGIVKAVRSFVEANTFTDDNGVTHDWNYYFTEAHAEQDEIYPKLTGKPFTDAKADAEVVAKVLQGFFADNAADAARTQVALDAWLAETVKTNKTGVTYMWHKLSQMVKRLRSDIKDRRARKADGYDAAARERELMLRRIEDIRDRFGRALMEAKKQGTKLGNAAFSIRSENANVFNPKGLTLDEQLEEILNTAESFDGRYLYIGEFTEPFIKLVGKYVDIEKLPIAMNYRDAYLAMESKENGKYQGEGINYHNLGTDGMKKAIEAFSDPEQVMLSKKSDRIELILECVDYKGDKLLAIIDLNTTTRNGNKFIDAHIVTSIYGRRKGDKYVDKAEEDGRLIYSKTKELTQGISQVQYEGNINANSIDSISHPDTNVNTSGESFSYTPDSDYIGTMPINDAEAANRKRALEMYRQLDAGKDIGNGKMDPAEYIYMQTGWAYDGLGNFVVDHEAPIYIDSSEQHRMANRRADHAEGVNNALRSENAGLREGLSRALTIARDASGMRSADYTTSAKAARTIIGRVTDMFGGGYTKKQAVGFAKKLLAIYDKRGEADAYGVRAVSDAEIAEEVGALVAEMQEVRIEDSERRELANKLKEELKAPVFLSEKARGDFSTGYGKTANAYRGRVNFTAKESGTPVDVRYEELSGMFPDLFPTDIVNEADQALKMLEISDMIRDEEFATDDRYMFSGGEAQSRADAIDAARAIFEGFAEMDAVPKTEADRYAREAEKARRDADEVRKNSAEQIASETERIRAEERRRADEEIAWVDHYRRNDNERMEAEYREGLQRADERVDQIAENYRNATDAMAADYRETIEKQTEQAAKAYQKERIKRLYNRLKKLLDHPTKNRNIKEGERDMVDEALKLMESIFVEKVTPRDMQGLDFAYATETEQKNLEHLQGLYDKLAELEAKLGMSKTTEVTEIASDGRNKMLKEADLEDYIKTGKSLHTRNKKSRLLEAGKNPILKTFREIRQFIYDAINGKALGEVRACGIVGSNLAKAIHDVNSSLDVEGRYIELNADDIRESYKRHSQPKEKGDIPLSDDDFTKIPEYLDDFDGVLSVDKYNNKIEIHLYKALSDGYVRILTVSSKERNSLIVSKLVGVSKEKFESKYGKKIERYAGSPRGQNASNPPTEARLTAGDLSNDIISQELDAVKSEIKKYENRLSELFGRKRSEIQNMKVSGLMSRFAAEYGKLKDAEEGYISDAYDPAVHDRINRLASDKNISGKTLRQLSSTELEQLYEAFAAAVNVVYRSNNMFADSKDANVTDNAVTAISELDKVEAKRPTGRMNKFIDKHFKWSNFKPQYAMRYLGSKTISRLFNNLRRGEDVYAVDIRDARKFFDEMSAKYGSKKWDKDEVREFYTESGQRFELTLDQVMSIYAYSRREQAADHFSDGGIVIKKDADKLWDESKHKATKKDSVEIDEVLRGIVGDATAYKMSGTALETVINSLTKEQRGFVDEMQAYLSDVMAAKGNEVSMKLYGIELFKEKFYFPLKSATQFMRVRYDDAHGDVRIKNKGMTKETVSGANNPIVIEGFMNVWASHVDEMSMYHALVLPMEDFTRVYGYTGGFSNEAENISVRAVIENLYGSNATAYIDKLIRDINGGVRVDSAGMFDSFISKSKKASVLASLSVAIQQPTAGIRAMAYIDPKYFGGKKAAKSDAKTWEECKKYCPIAIIKEMGRFDTGTGVQTKKYITGDKTWRDKVDDAAGWLSSKADEVTWGTIWEACKREVADKNSSLKTNDAICRAAAERFNEVVTLTQVYDSVFARSETMRAKDPLHKMATSFMSEPVTVANMVFDAFVQARRGNKAILGRVISSVVVSTLVNNALKSIIYAMRDDDEDETFLEKYLAALVSSSAESINPLTYLPYVRDIWSLLQGYDVERTDVALIGNLIDAVVSLGGNGSVDKKIEKLAGAIGDAFVGVPVKNILRDLRGIYNGAVTIASDISGKTPTTRLGITNAIKDSFIEPLERMPFVGDLIDTDSRADVLYKAVMTDKAHAERMRSSYKDEVAYETALKTGLRENDERITEAAEAWFAGDIDVYDDIANEIVAEGKFDKRIVVGAIKSAYNAMSTEDTVRTPDKSAVSIYTADMVGTAFELGDEQTALEAVEDLIGIKVSNSGDEKKARSIVKSSVTKVIKPIYLEAYASGDNSEMERVKQFLIATGLYGDDGDKAVSGWEKEHDKENGDTEAKANDSKFKFNIPKVTVPKVEVPKFDIPKVEVPKFNFDF